MSNPIDESTITERLTILRNEYQHGSDLLTQLEQQAEETRAQLLRIAGAIRLCEELLGEAEDDGA